jgi:hypothetical protein
VRDLTLVPAGKYAMVQGWEQRGEETSERRGAEPEQTAVSASNRFTFSVEVGPRDRRRPTEKDLVVSVKRVEVRTDDASAPLAYDSAGPAAKQSEVLHRQFRYLVGGVARVGAAAFSDGEGFRGLGEVWDRFAEEHPEMSRAAEANRANYGDTRLDRMFAEGLDLLFGADAGRAKGSVRDLRRGEEFTTTATRPGIFMRPTPVEHACKVVSVGRTVVLQVEWRINGHEPQVERGAVSVRGGDIVGVATLTFLADSGLLVGLDERTERTDQVAPGPRPGIVQWTRRVVEKRTFSLTKP